MDREKRREGILNLLSTINAPVSGTKLADIFGVSRQVIVQDIAILKVDNKNIISTSQGYILSKPLGVKRIFRVRHNDVEIEDELNCIVDHGGMVLDVFIEHNIYGKIKTDLFIKNRLDVKRFMENFLSGKASALKNLTFNYHYHTVEAVSAEILDIIENELKEKHYLIF